MLVHKKGTKLRQKNIDIKLLEQKVEDLIMFAFKQTVELKRAQDLEADKSNRLRQKMAA